MLPWIAKNKKEKYNSKLTDKQIQENLKEIEKGDIIAMIIAAFITFVPVIAGILLVFYLILYLIFLR